MDFADIVEQWFQAHFHNNTFYQQPELFAQAQAAKADLLQRLENAAQAEAEKIAVDFKELAAKKPASSKQ